MSKEPKGFISWKDAGPRKVVDGCPVAPDRVKVYFLSELSDKVAEALAKFRGEELYLNGLISLTDKAAEALAKCKAVLFLNGIESLSDIAAEALTGHKGTVELYGLNELSEQGSLSLSKNKSIAVSDQLARQIENAVKNHAQTTSTLTSKDQSKIRKLITSQDADNVDFACNLLASLNASEGDWLKLFPKTRIYKLLSNFYSVLLLFLYWPKLNYSSNHNFQNLQYQELL